MGECAVIFVAKTFEGHKGIPGHRGGSRPRNYFNYDEWVAKKTEQQKWSEMVFPPLDDPFWDDKGVGSVSVQRHDSLPYMGMYREMRPQEFLENALRLQDYELDNNSSNWMLEEAKKGTKFAPPVLFVVWDKKMKRWQVSSHEGRHRVRTFKQLYGGKLIPVAIVFDNGVRRGDLTPAQVKAPIHTQRNWNLYTYRQ